MNTHNSFIVILAFFICTILVLPGFALNHPTAIKRIDPTYTESSQGLPTVGQWPFDTRVGDVNHDGSLDLVRLRGHDDFNPEDEGFQIWLGDGHGLWTKTAIPNGNFGYGGTALGDFNNDGLLDAAYGCHHYNSHPMIGAWTGDGGTSFTEHSTGLATDGETFGMSACDLADINNDGYLDLIVGGFSISGLRAYINHDGGQSWTSASNGLPHADTSPMTNHWIRTPDLNRDGYLDIVNQERDIDDTTHFIWTGDGTGNWTPNDYGLPVEWYRGNDGLDIGDINYDGWPDITFIHHAGSDGYPVVYTFTGTDWTPASTGLPTTQNYGPLAFGDLNNDGLMDLVGLEILPNSQTAVHAWLGDGTGHWTELPTIATGIVGGPESLTLADIDHNNHLDIILSSESDGDYTPGGLHVFKETTPATTLNILLRNPTGGEVYTPGAVRTITWTSSIPSGTATVDLEYSLTGADGPWYPIASGILDSNSYQWHIPSATTHQGYIRATIHWNSQQATWINLYPFTIAGGGPNSPPNAPTITGPAFGMPNQPIPITFCATDPDNDTVQIYVEWGGENTSDWLPPTPSGVPITVNHTWHYPGIFTTRAKARDVTYAEGPWSAPYNITISPLNITLNFYPGYFTVTVVNMGTETFTNFTLAVTRDGGILHRHKTDRATIELPPQNSLKTYMPLIGLGIVTIGYSVSADQFAAQTWSITGRLFFIYFKV